MSVMIVVVSVMLVSVEFTVCHVSGSGCVSGRNHPISTPQKCVGIFPAASTE